jgi:hypothetical protein
VFFVFGHRGDAVRRYRKADELRREARPSASMTLKDGELNFVRTQLAALPAAWGYGAAEYRNTPEHQLHQAESFVTKDPPLESPYYVVTVVSDVIFRNIRTILDRSGPVALMHGDTRDKLAIVTMFEWPDRLLHPERYTDVPARFLCEADLSFSL